MRATTTADSPAVLLHTNVVTNPSAETTGAVVTVRTNLAIDPRAVKVGAIGAGGFAWAPRWFGAAPGAGTTVSVTGASDGPVGVSSYLRKTWTVAPPGGAAADVGFVHTNVYGTGTSVTGKPVTGGTTYTLSSYLRPSRAQTVAPTWSLRIAWHDAAGVFLSTSVGATTALPAGVWTRLTLTATAPAAAAFAEVLSSNFAGTSGTTVGDTLDGTALLMEVAPAALPYFDGASAAAGDYTHAWSGAANNSTSVQRAPSVSGAAGQAGYATVYSSTEWAARGERSLRISAQRSNGDTFAELTMLGRAPSTLAGQVVTLVGTIRLTAAQTGTLSPNARRFRVSVRDAASVITEITGAIVWTSTAPNAPGVYEVRGTVTIPADAVTWSLVRLYHGGSVGSADVWWDAFGIISGAYGEPAFDGSTPDTATRDYAWTGTPDASMSTVSTVASSTDRDALALTSSHALTCDAYLFTSQPTPNEAPARRLALLDGTFTDDAANGYARGYTLRVADPLVDITPGSWVQVRVGAVGQTRDIYTLPTLFISSALAAGQGTQVTCVDIGACLDEIVFERDETLTGTLRSLAAALTSGVPSLTHPPDVTQVPALTIPANTVAEFGHGRWKVLLSVADQLGVDLLWTDVGDLLGIIRTDAPPAPVARLDDYLTDAGQAERNRPVVRAVVQVARDKTLPELVGVATTGSTNGVTVSDRQDGDATTTQAQADALAAGLLARRRSERNVREIDIAPAPWLEAGTDTVTLDGRAWWVRAMSVHLPDLATALTLRDAS